MKYFIVMLLGAVLGAVVMFHAFPVLRPAPLPELLQSRSEITPVVIVADRDDTTPQPYPDGGAPPQEPVELSVDGAIAPVAPTDPPMEPPPISLSYADPAATPAPAAGATPAPIGPVAADAQATSTATPTSPPLPEPVAPNAIAAATAAGESTDAPHEPEAEAKALATPTYVAQPGALLVPVNGIESKQLLDTFEEGRGDRRHEAIDILAPAGTPVVAVEDGKVVKLFDSKRGGLTVYQFDPTEKFAYYYAHLQGYAPGIAEGKVLKRGDLVGYVGTTGNANPQTPHLHFAVFVLDAEKRWWQGTAINPYPLLGGNRETLAADATPN